MQNTFIATIIMLFVIYSKHPTIQVDVYSGPVLNGTLVGHSTIYRDGTVNAFTENGGVCFSTVESWCDATIKSIGDSKTYLISDTSYGNDDIVRAVFNCQRKMIGDV
jgi:hypothetical protein